MSHSSIRHDWTQAEVEEIFQRPLLDLVYDAATVHRQHNNHREVQICSLINIKEGGCPENCSYCSQSSSHSTGVKATPLMEKERVLATARRAKEQGATRVCLGAAWREVRNSPQFTRVLDIVSAVNDLGIEVCCTLGMLTEEQAHQLKEAGLYAYNHNLDTSEEYYKYIITTRKYEDRTATIDNAEKANLSVCCGGIIGMGESEKDRISLLRTLATRNLHPESVPINVLIPIKGTPLENQKPASFWELLRMVATARILMPEAMVRLSAGRNTLSKQEQAFCFFAGANSIHSGERLLTTPTHDFESDQEMFQILGLEGQKPFAREPALV